MPRRQADSLTPMSAHELDDAGPGHATLDDPAPAPRVRDRRDRRIWVQGGSSTQRWRADLLGWAALAAGLGLLAAAASHRFIGGALGNWLALFAIWLGFVVPVVIALTRSVPRGLFRWRWTDLMVGVALGLAIRGLQGAVQGYGLPRPWPSYLTFNGSLPPTWWLDQLLIPGVITPVVEELFFHGLLLVALYTLVRRHSHSKIAAGTASALAVTGVFVLMHVATSSAITGDAAVGVAAIGLVGAVVVLLTGRIWAAVILHLVYNLSYVALALIGTAAALAG